MPGHCVCERTGGSGSSQAYRRPATTDHASTVSRWLHNLVRSRACLQGWRRAGVQCVCPLVYGDPLHGRLTSLSSNQLLAAGVYTRGAHPELGTSPSGPTGPDRHCPTPTHRYCPELTARDFVKHDEKNKNSHSDRQSTHPSSPSPLTHGLRCTQRTAACERNIIHEIVK